MSDIQNPTTVTDVAVDLADKAVPAVVVTSSTKAFIGAAVAGVTSGAAALASALTDNVITGGEWITILAAIAVGAGLTGQSVYSATNKRVVS
jgi:hypothetical protein